MVETRFSIAYEPSLLAAEMQALVDIERLCYPPLTRYSRATISRFLRLPGSLLVRAHAIADERVAGFQISNYRFCQLITLDVHPDFQRQGIGSAILGCTLEQFRMKGAPLAQCEISVNNRASIELHRKFGFIEIGTIEEYYEDNTDALVMVLPLRNN